MVKNRTSVPSSSGRPHPSLVDLEAAVVRTVTYADLFNYPLTAAQVHRYLEGVPASQENVAAVLANGRLIPHQLHHQNGYFMLPDRQEIAALRQEREQIAQRLWSKAVRYGRILAHLPFVRMVAVTGSLTMNNAESDGDIDYLIVTENGRVWLSRAFIIAIVRLARRDQVELCPNYILSAKALEFPDRNLYVAHELAQMVPLSGLTMYRRIRQINQWADDFLPNAAGPPHTFAPIRRRWPQKAAELPLRTPVGHWLEQWEMTRKIRKLQRQEAETEFTETDFSPDWCKGHFDGYNGRTMHAYRQRVD